MRSWSFLCLSLLFACAYATSVNWIRVCATHPICRFAYNVDDDLAKVATPATVPEWAVAFVRHSEEAYRVRYANLTRDEAIQIVSMLESRIFTMDGPGLRCSHPRETAVMLDGKIQCVCAPRHDCSVAASDLAHEITVRDTPTTLSIVFFVLGTLATLAIFTQVVVLACTTSPLPIL